MKLLNRTVCFCFFKWNLICDRGFLGAALQSVFFAGMLIGSFSTGIISDAWGRKKCIFASMAVMVSSKLFSLLRSQSLAWQRGHQVNKVVRLSAEWREIVHSSINKINCYVICETGQFFYWKCYSVNVDSNFAQCVQCVNGSTSDTT